MGIRKIVKLANNLMRLFREGKKEKLTSDFNFMSVLLIPPAFYWIGL